MDDKQNKAAETAMKMRVMFMFTLLMCAGKDPMPFLLRLYLSWKQKQ